jgi:hypothetical protein
LIAVGFERRAKLVLLDVHLQGQPVQRPLSSTVK